MGRTLCSAAGAERVHVGFIGVHSFLVVIFLVQFSCLEVSYSVLVSL